MQDCMFKGKIETCIICSYYFACKARGDISKREEDEYFAKKLSQTT